MAAHPDGQSPALPADNLSMTDWRAANNKKLLKRTVKQLGGKRSDLYVVAFLCIFKFKVLSRHTNKILSTIASPSDITKALYGGYGDTAENY